MNVGSDKLWDGPYAELAEKAGLRSNINNLQTDSFPKIQRRGETILVYASGYWTPWRLVQWERICSFVNRGIVRLLFLAVIIFFGLAVIGSFTGDSKPNASVGGIRLTFVLSVLVFLSFTTGFRRVWGRLLCGKKSVVEFTADEIRIYKHGYGWPASKVFQRLEGNEVSAAVVEHPHSSLNRFDQGSNRKQAIAHEVYLHSRQVNLTYGGLIEDVTGTVDEASAKRYAQAIMKAEQVRLDRMAAKEQEQAEEEELPE